MTVKYILEGGARRPDSIAVAYDDRWKLLTSEKSLNAKSSSCQLRRSTHHSHSSFSPIHRPPGNIVALATSGSTRVRKSSPAADRVDVDSTHEALARRCRTTPRSIAKFPTPLPPTARSTSFSPNGATPTRTIRREWVLSNFDPRRASNLAIRPRETEPIVEESLNVSAGLTTLARELRSNPTPGMTGANRVELSVPANLTINEITVTEDDQPIPVRWSRLAKNRVSVFFAQQVTKPYRLVLDGTTPVDRERQGTPAAHFHTGHGRRNSKDSLVSRRRRPSRARRTSLDDRSKSGPTGPASVAMVRRPVTTCYLESGSATARIVVKPNKFKIAGDSLTTLTRENGAWWANYRCQLSVEDGNLDILRLRIAKHLHRPVRSPIGASGHD